MNKKYFLLAFVALSFTCLRSATAQMVGTDIFLPGQFVEIGQNNIGAFGTSSSPSTYYPYLGYGASNLAEVYDWGHDGWTVGSPAEYGDYTYPGSPFEGWELQVAGSNSQAFTNSGSSSTISTSGGGDLTGNNLSYVNSGGQLIANWQGTASSGNLTINQQTLIDTSASQIVFTTVFKNTSASPITGIYYMRSCDPDNDEAHGGSFSTNNTIVHQNEDVTHAVEVDAEGMTYNDHWSLCTRDCRATAFIYSYWPLSSTVDLSGVWAKTSSASSYGYGDTAYALGSTYDGDIAIGLVFNVGTIAAGDSAVISYAYVFNDSSSDIFTAFPDPELSINGVTASNAPLPNPTIDTFNSCLYPALTSTPINIFHGATGDWTWGKWKWAPSTGLAATTGVTNTVNLTVLPSSITYTITGSDSGINGASCNNKVFYLTILSCHSVFNNSPCVGDVLLLGYRGDSTGATYSWTGPGGFTSTLQYPSISPSVAADSGEYYVTKTSGYVSITDSTHVIMHLIPVVSISTNAPLCAHTDPSILDTLTLLATPSTTGESFSWTGPNGFTSGMANPVIDGFTSMDIGIYKVVTTLSICSDSAYYNVTIIPPITAAFTDAIHLGCNGDSVFLTNMSTPSDFYSLWSFGDGTALDTNSNPIHIYYDTPTHMGTYNITLVFGTPLNPACNITTTQSVTFNHPISAAFTVDQDSVCLGVPITFTNSSIGNGATYIWRYGDETTDTTTNPVHTYAAGGVYDAVLTVTDTLLCSAIASQYLDIVAINVQPTVHDTSVCLTDSMSLHALVSLAGAVDGLTYQWSPTNNIGEPNDSVTKFFGTGNFTYTITVTTLPLGCSASDTETIHSYLPVTLTGVTASETITAGSSAYLNADGATYYRWTPNDGTLNNNNINNPVATPVDSFTTYTVYGMNAFGCLDSAQLTITLHYTTPEFIPTAFSPNHDGRNDVFKVGNFKNSKLVDFRVFNRWGQAIFQTSNSEVGWDGTFNGTPQDIGTYNYMIIIAHSDGVEETFTGSVTLVR